MTISRTAGERPVNSLFPVTDNTSTQEVEAYAERYLRAFNTGDIDAVNAFYTDDAVSIWEPGEPLTGPARRERIAEFMAQRPQMRTKLLNAIVTSDTALLVSEWEMDVASADGGRETLAGVAHDVLRRDETGTWRHAIDNPWGEAASGQDE
jgi:uncharacterized protein (TIGR02246 family)